MNHFAIFRNVGVEPLTYPYYDPTTIGLDYAGFIGALESAPERSVFLLHACAHNPTGVDPTPEQWNKIADVVLARGHYAFFDCAYQGFASGDLDRDAMAVREFVKRGVPLLVCQVRPLFCLPLIRGEGADGCVAELCKERGVVWGARGRAACGRADEGGGGARAQPAVGAPAERDQQPARARRAPRTSPSSLLHARTLTVSFARCP